MNMTTVSLEELCQRVHDLAEAAKAAFEAMAEALQRIARYLSELWRNGIEPILGYNSDYSRTHCKKHTLRRPAYSETVFAGGKPYNRRNHHEDLHC